MLDIRQDIRRGASCRDQIRQNWTTGDNRIIWFVGGFCSRFLPSDGVQSTAYDVVCLVIVNRLRFHHAEPATEGPCDHVSVGYTAAEQSPNGLSPADSARRRSGSVRAMTRGKLLFDTIDIHIVDGVKSLDVVCARAVPGKGRLKQESFVVTFSRPIMLSLNSSAI